MFDNTTSNSTKQVVAATDAAINMNGVTITRASNTFTDLIEGYEFKLNPTTTSAATVISNLDADLAYSNVKDFVNVYNSVTSTLKTLSQRGLEGEGGVLSRDVGLHQSEINCDHSFLLS